MSADVDGMVDRALAESREGGLPSRVWRYATGGEVDVAISPQITYSNKAVDRVRRQGRGRGQPRSGRCLDRADHELAEPGKGLGWARRGRGQAACRGSSPRCRARTRAPSRCRSTGRARGDHRGARRAVPDLPDRRPLQLRALAVEGPGAGQDLHRRDRRPGLRHTGRRLRDREHGWSTPSGASPTPIGPATSPGPRSRAEFPRTR